jgi:hypothetical protein
MNWRGGSLSRLFPVVAPAFQIPRTGRSIGTRLRDLPHIKIRSPRIVSAQTSRGDTNMRKFILIAGFVFASAAAQAGDRSLSLGGVETQAAPAPARADTSKSAEAETPKYVERPAVVEPKAETTKPETSRAETRKTERARPSAARAQRYATRPASAGAGSPSARRAAMMSRGAGGHRMRLGIRARIIMALHRHGIYW